MGTQSLRIQHGHPFAFALKQTKKYSGGRGLLPDSDSPVQLASQAERKSVVAQMSFELEWWLQKCPTLGSTKHAPTKSPRLGVF